MSDAMKPEGREPDYKAAMLYHSDRADGYMAERDALAARIADLERQLDASLMELAETQALELQHGAVIERLTRQLAERKCPIGISPASHMLCSAGTCDVCTTSRQLAEGRDKALEEAAVVAGGSLTVTDAARRIRNMKGPTPRFTEWPEEDFDITVGKRKDTP